MITQNKLCIICEGKLVQVIKLIHRKVSLSIKKYDVHAFKIGWWWVFGVLRCFSWLAISWEVSRLNVWCYKFNLKNWKNISVLQIEYVTRRHLICYVLFGNWSNYFFRTLKLDSIFLKILFAHKYLSGIPLKHILTVDCSYSAISVASIHCWSVVSNCTIARIQFSTSYYR